MKNISLIALLFLSLSCSKKDNPDMEIKDLPKSIQALIDEAQQECPVCGITVLRYTYNKKVLYASTCNGPACNCIMAYYDEDGELIKYEEGIYKDINEKKNLIKEIYRCSE
ncbi:hypothetical protein [Agriterribacter sp.]|uniref:hypothetical protein n=1 Tax=Agriterribacter sp. TaxID=2821509 RepID=UPI002D05F2A7|nr:hypothetical protein [Agriterribacter sp.]HTN05980.1 hypothetical protein [Agriterribacter sp.]